MAIGSAHEPPQRLALVDHERDAQPLLVGTPMTARLIPVEAFIWSVTTRGLLHLLRTEQVIHLLDVFPRRSQAPTPVTPPSEHDVRHAGACLGRSLARSQFLRLRGQPHAVVIGTRGGISAFEAHAWLDPFDLPPHDFIEIRRIPR
jgi:hypothetical protein